MAYGIANLGTGFLEGFRTVDDYYNAQERQRLAREEMALRKNQDTRAQQEHDAKMERDRLNKEDGEFLAQHTASFFGVEMKPRGVQMGPPNPDGSMPPEQPAPSGLNLPAMPGAVAAPQPKSLAELQKEAEAYMAKAAPVMARLFARNDPVKGAEFAAKINDVKVQRQYAQQAALGKAVLLNPSSPETRDAVVEWYKTIPDGKDIVKESWRVDEKNNIHFSVRTENGEVKPEIITPAQAKGMMMQTMTASQIADDLRGDETLAETKRHNKTVEDRQAAEAKERADNMRRDDKRAEREFGIRMEEIRLARQDRNEQRGLDREARKDAATARERDEVFRGVTPFFLPKEGLNSLTPEEQQAATQGAADAIDVVNLNDLGKTSQAGARAAGYVKQIAAGNARVVPHPQDPAYVIADVGGKKIKLPASSYTVTQYQKAKSQPPKK